MAVLAEVVEVEVSSSFPQKALLKILITQSQSEVEEPQLRTGAQKEPTRHSLAIRLKVEAEAEVVATPTIQEGAADRVAAVVYDLHKLVAQALLIKGTMGALAHRLEPLLLMLAEGEAEVLPPVRMRHLKLVAMVEMAIQKVIPFIIGLLVQEPWF
jgi:hypothetical protein